MRPFNVTPRRGGAGPFLNALHQDHSIGRFDRVMILLQLMNRLFLVFFLSLNLGCGNSQPPQPQPSINPWEQAFYKGENPQRPEMIALGIGAATIEVEVAGDEYGKQLGLMFRKEMPADAGMWFAFPETDFRRFWMQNTFIPLSIAYVDEGGVITNIEDMIPLDESPVRSKRKARYALEMNRGWFKKKGIKPEDRIRIGQLKPNPAYIPPD